MVINLMGSVIGEVKLDFEPYRREGVRLGAPGQLIGMRKGETENNKWGRAT